ncbi:MAG TPA: AAA family ATPase [Bryobacteraceae bacterium]|nr:AAA family ATPase [Bryobacteraceae bacterium]
MLLRQLTLENLLSFRKTTVELRGLNVLIGPNAVGKSNLIEAISLLQAAPVDISAAILRLGGVRVVCSLAASNPIAAIECDGVDHEPLKYRLDFAEQANGFVVLNESLAEIDGGVPYFKRVAGQAIFAGEEVGSISPSQSVFGQYKNPADRTPITRIGSKFERVRIYREFRTTGEAPSRTGISTSSRKDSLHDGGDNLALVLLEMDFRGLHDRIRAYLRRFCDRFENVKVRLDGPIAKTYIEESGLLEPLASWRLSDGTLKFLCLLAVLLEKELPPLICIEEPEVGLHPEAIQIVASALAEASERTQLIVTTHSEALVDALSDRPEDILVTERDFENSTQFKRLDRQRLSSWLERYSLGALWRKGEIGGNRW